MKLIKSSSFYTREKVFEDKENLYIFTDNCDRTSGWGTIPDDSEYSKRFGKINLKFPKVTTALIRGLDNAYPVTTQKHYIKGKESYKGNWTDDDFDEFKEVIDSDFEAIKKAIKEKGYKQVIFPIGGILNRNISKLTIERTPKLFNYIIEKEKELKEYEDN